MDKFILQEVREDIRTIAESTRKTSERIAVLGAHMKNFDEKFSERISGLQKQMSSKLDDSDVTGVVLEQIGIHEDNHHCVEAQKNVFARWVGIGFVNLVTRGAFLILIIKMVAEEFLNR